MGSNGDIYIIVAMTEKRVIGRDNRIPWHIPEDLKMFKQITDGNIVIMGKKTYESIGKPLPNRHNIIISKTLRSVAGAEVYKSLDEGIRRAKEIGKKIFCIGGAEIYISAIKDANFMYISWIKDNYNGDTKFPEFDISDWELVSETSFREFTLSRYQKKGLRRSFKKDTLDSY